MHGAIGQAVQLRLDVLDVFLELEDHVQRVAHQIGVERVAVQQQQGARPVDGLADGGHLLQVHLPQFLNERDQLPAQFRRNFRDAGVNDALLQFDIRERDVQMQAAALQRVGDFARVVGCQEHERRLVGGLHGADFRNRNLEVGQDFQQQ